MCTCASCKYTDSFSGWRNEQARDGSLIPDESGGFAEWPRGEPAGARSSAAAYAVHQRHCPPIAKPWKFIPPRNDKLPITEHQFPGRESFPQWARTMVCDGPIRGIKTVRKPTPRLLALAQQLRRAA